MRICIAAVLFLCYSGAAFARDCSPILGRAVNSKTKLPAFTEVYELDCMTGKTGNTASTGDSEPSRVKVHFINPEGVTIVEEEAVFLARPFLPETTFHDVRDHFKYRIKPPDTTSDDIELSLQPGMDAEQKIYKIKNEPLLMTYLGAMRFVGDSVEKLKAGETLNAKLVVPSRHDAYSVRFRGELVKRDGAELLDVHVELANALYRLFAPEMTLTYDLKTHELLFFKGNAPILDGHDKPIPVEISYRHEAPGKEKSK